jgi:hypothetical protein
MVKRESSRRVLVLLLAAASGGASLAAANGPRNSIVQGMSAKAVDAAAAGARRRLSAPKCQEVFADFADSSGHTLKARLDALGVTPVEYLSFVEFRDGSGEGRCARSGILAFTSPGSPIIFVCPEFGIWHHSDAPYTEAVVIHEVLHSLGLGENPPTSVEITDRILKGCGR